MCVRNKIGSGRKASTQSKENKRQIASTSAGVSFIEDDKKIEIRKTGRQKGAVKVKGKKTRRRKKNYRC